MKLQSAAVIGLGLIGGSVARDLAARGVRVLGYDRDAATLKTAVEEGVVEQALDDDLSGVGEAEVVVLALPVSAAAAALRALQPQLSAARLVTDVGSTKRGIVAAAVEAGLGDRFVGSHPLAGSEASGWIASREGLFRDAPVYLCPTPATTPTALALAQELWTALGGVPEVIEADAHDRKLAWTSHLPQATSTALALALDAAGVTPADLGPGGRSATRLAGSSPEVWADVLLENADEVVSALGGMERSLRELRDAVAADDREALLRLLSAGHRWSSGDRA